MTADEKKSMECILEAMMRSAVERAVKNVLEGMGLKCRDIKPWISQNKARTIPGLTVNTRYRFMMFRNY